jgi:2-polyprenyl-3-methyl-5-hydroxy-6-metoxy-1,4-benzoquinol methylase
MSIKFTFINKKKEILSQYNKAFKKKYDFKKVLWSNKKSMINRYKLFFKFIKYKKFKFWLDVGSGVGSIFSYHDRLNIKIDKRLGIEINKNLYNFSIKKKYKKETAFKNIDIYNYKSMKKYDLISLIGVLQNCAHTPEKFLKRIFLKLRKNGIVFLTTKNLLWERFLKNKKPTKIHSWFNPIYVKKIFEKNSIKVIKINSFDSQSLRILPIKKSSNFFILGKKIA